MAKINIIDSSVYNLIAAGEVVERPLSVIKECVENSLDACSSAITVRVWNDAKCFRITDNGVGMSREDAKLAFMPHCTSKIKTAQDLTFIRTLGFRGEALASIAAVSMITMNTFDHDTHEATKIVIRGGVVESVEESGITVGTDLLIENLFFNTPVREKFLRKPRSEESEITNLISRLVLANPDISICYYLNDVCKLKFNGSGMEDAIFAVYGKETLANVYQIDYDNGEILVQGFIGKQSFLKANRSYQTTIINGRYVIDQTVAAAVYQAYSKYLMTKTFPFFVLRLAIPHDIVDVNVHPTKQEVRFSDSQKIFRAVYSAVSAVLDGTREAYKIVKNDFSLPAEDKSSDGNRWKDDDTDIANDSKIEEPANEQGKTVFERDFDELTKLLKTAGENTPLFSEQTAKQNFDDSAPIFAKPIIPQKQEIVQYIDTEGKPRVGIVADSDVVKKTVIDANRIKLIGVYLNTYIMFEYDETLYVVDQHAAHELITYENYSEKVYNNKISTVELIEPYVFSVNPREDDFLQENISQLFVMGFKIEEFGDKTYRVYEVPTDCTDINLKAFFEDYFSSVDELSNVQSSQLLKRRLMTKACKYAVKAGTKLTIDEMIYLLGLLFKCGKVNCPHGRPVIISISKEEVEKWFKRIV